MAYDFLYGLKMPIKCPFNIYTNTSINLIKIYFKEIIENIYIFYRVIRKLKYITCYGINQSNYSQKMNEKRLFVKCPISVYFNGSPFIK